MARVRVHIPPLGGLSLRCLPIARLLTCCLLLSTLAHPILGDYLGDYKRGRRAMQHGRWGDAAELLQQALSEKSQEGEMVRLYGVRMEPYLPRLHLAHALFELGDFRSAELHLQQSEQHGAILEMSEHGDLLGLRARIEQQLASSEQQGDIQFELQGVPGNEQQTGEVPPSIRISQHLQPQPWQGTKLQSSPPSAPSTTTSPLGFEESYALVVGASRYRAGWPQLPGVRRDVPEVAAALRRHGFQVWVIEDPSKRQLEQAMDDFFFAASKSEASRLVFYYAGHGATLPDEDLPRGYIVPVDAPRPQANEGRFLAKAISVFRFQEYARETRARHVLFLFDSCFSGTVFEVMRSPLPGSVQERLRQRSRFFITAGESDQEVPDQSYFRRAFVEALSGAADTNGDGVIFGVELGEYVKDRVIDYFFQSANPQTPRWGIGRDYRGDFPFRTPTAERP